MSRLRFSVVIPVYNVAPYICECIESVLSQNYNDIEVICVDDGALDGSGDILDELATRDDRLVVVHQANKGVSAARNKGLDLVHGEWIVYLDGDDIMMPGLLREMVDIIEQEPEKELIVFGLEQFDSTGRLARISPENLATVGFCQMAYRHDKFKQTRFPAYGMGEDRVYAYRCLSVRPRIGICNTVGYGYRIREGSATHSLVKRHSFCDLVRYECELLWRSFFVQMPLSSHLRHVWKFVRDIVSALKD